MYTVLIVEDEMLERIGLRYGVNWDKYDMTVVADVANGAEGWNEYLKHKPDVLVTDLKMPVVDGMTLIDRIRKEDSQIKVIIVSCVDDFAVAREAISYGVSGYILKSSMDMQETESVIAKVAQELENSHRRPIALPLSRTEIDLRPWMRDEMDSAELAERLAGAVEPMASEQVQVYAAQAMNKKEILAKPEIQTRAGNIITSLIGEQSACHLLACTEGTVVWAVRGTEAAIQEVSRYLQEQIRDALSNYLNLDVRFGFSLAEKGEELERCIADSLNSLKDTFFTGGDVQCGTALDRRARYMTLCAVVQNTLKEQGAEQCLDMLKRSMWIDAAGYISCKRIREIARDVIRLLRFQTDQSEQIAQLEADCRAELEKCMSISALTKTLCGFIAELWRQKNEEDKTASMEAALRYLNDHICENPSLDDAAAQAGLSPSYFSACFRREMGVGFSEYMTRIRMEKACVMLLSTNMSIAEIAEALGYYDTSHFIRVFRKIMQMSPRQYRTANRG